MKSFVVLAVFVQLAAAFAEVQPQTRALAFTYQSGAVAAYPVGTTIIYSAGAQLDYVAGASVTYVYNTIVNFPADTEVYTQSGPVTYKAGSSASFAAGSQVAYAPGTSVRYGSTAETRYGQFNGNTHAIAGYPQQTSVQYYYGPNGSNLILFAPGSNPLQYYNPGGSTQFGPSALPVEKEPETPVTTRTYGYYGGGGYGGGYSYCGGYSCTGWPQTNYVNYNTGYRSSCRQTCYNCYSYSNNGGGGGGGMYGK